MKLPFKRALEIYDENRLSEHSVKSFCLRLILSFNMSSHKYTKILQKIKEEPRIVIPYETYNIEIVKDILGAVKGDLLRLAVLIVYIEKQNIENYKLTPEEFLENLQTHYGGDGRISLGITTHKYTASERGSYRAVIYDTELFYFPTGYSIVTAELISAIIYNIVELSREEKMSKENNPNVDNVFLLVIALCYQWGLIKENIKFFENEKRYDRAQIF